jgi:hypothetical protein
MLTIEQKRMNLNRAEWAASAIAKFQTETGTDWDDALKDLLCNLMHFCDHNTFEDGETKFDFDSALATGRMHYDAEISGED